MNRIVTTTLVVALGLLVTSGASWAASGRCTTAVVAEPFLLPDGSEHPAGALTLCVRQAYSPVASLHETYVDGMPIGMLTSRHSIARGSDVQGSFLVFDRLADGRLSLLGYTSACRDGIEVYALRYPKSRAAENLERIARAADKPAEDMLVVAAMR